MDTAFVPAQQIIDRAVEARAFPAAVVEAGDTRSVLWQHAAGRLSFDPGAAPADRRTIFDLASLTKVIATASLAMQAIERGTIGLDDAVSAHSPAWNGPGRDAVTIRDLLSHAAGLAAHEPLFRTLAGRQAFEAAIGSAPLAYVPRSQSLYSDLGFMLLGFILERRQLLADQFTALMSHVGPGQELQFRPPDRWRTRTAPTREDPWRGRRLVGEVDDDNAFALDGVAGHAGLFGTAEAVGVFARHILQVLNGRRGAFRRGTLEEFVSRRAAIPGSSRALGWDTMLPTSSCGTRMSARAFGHTGFTGTSLWIDPDARIYIVMLTNRVHPTPENEAIRQVRPSLHDAVMEALGRHGG